MLIEKQNLGQTSFLSTFEEQLTHKHPLYILANEIRWKRFEEEFTKHYNDKMGRPAKPIRLMVGLIILKHIRKLSDESVVEQWMENSYYQYFCGEESFVTKQPCDASELVHFRNRIGKEGMEMIFRESVRINGKDGNEKQVVVDTTVQEKNITFPTDNKLHRKIIDKCVGIAEKEDIELRQSYRRTVKKLSYQQRFRRSQKQQKIARKAEKKIKTIAGRLVREIERKLSADRLSEYSSTIELFKKVLSQKRSDNNKVYSIHEPTVECISKGKSHKKYEFGNKVSIMLTKNTGVIVGALSMEKNDYDGHTLEPALKQYKEFYNKEPEKAIVDLGYKGISRIGSTVIVSPQKKGKTLTEKRRLRNDHRRRSSIEANISHLKNNHRLNRNYYRYVIGDVINLLLSASAYNFRRMMRKWAEKMKYFLSILFSVFKHRFYPEFSLKILNVTF